MGLSYAGRAAAQCVPRQSLCPFTQPGVLGIGPKRAKICFAEKICLRMLIGQLVFSYGPGRIVRNSLVDEGSE